MQKTFICLTKNLLNLSTQSLSQLIINVSKEFSQFIDIITIESITFCLNQWKQLTIKISIKQYFICQVLIK